MNNDNKTKRNDTIFSFTVDRKTIFKSSINSFLIQIIFRLKGFITAPILTYLMLPSEMGVLNLIVVTSSVFAPFVNLNLPDGSAIYFSRERAIEKIRTMYLTIVNTIGISAILVTLIASLLIYFLRPDLYKYAFWAALLLYANIFYQISSFLLSTYQKTGLVVKNAFVRDSSATVMSIFFVYLGYSYKGMVIANVIAFLVSSFLLLRIVTKNMPYAFTIDTSYLRAFLKLSIPLLPVFFFSWIIQSSDSYFLAYYKGEGIVGKYSVIYGITNVILTITYALNFFWVPVSARLWVENRGKFTQAFRLLFTLFLTILLMVVLLFELNSKMIIHLLIRREEYYDAYAIMGILAFSFAMQVLITLLTAPLYSNKNTRTIFFAHLIGGLTNTILNFLIIPSTGIFGAAISTAVSYLTVVLVMSYMSYKLADFAFLNKHVFYIIGLFIFAWGGIFSTREYFEMYQSILASILVILVIGAIVYFKVLEKKEREYLFLFLKEFNIKRVIA